MWPGGGGWVADDECNIAVDNILSWPWLMTELPSVWLTGPGTAGLCSWCRPNRYHCIVSLRHVTRPGRRTVRSHWLITTQIFLLLPRCQDWTAVSNDFYFLFLTLTVTLIFLAEWIMFLLITNFISNRVDYNVRFASDQTGELLWLSSDNRISLLNLNLINCRKMARFTKIIQKVFR